MASTSREHERWDKMGPWERLARLGKGGFGASTSRQHEPWDKIGPWERLAKLGKGGFGAVYLGKRTSDAKLFAVKSVYFIPQSKGKDDRTPDDRKLRPKKMQEMYSLANLINEIRTLTKMKSPYIVRYLGCGTSKGPKEMSKRLLLDCYLEYLPRGSLSDIIEGSPRKCLEEPFAKAYTKDLLHALKYLHFNKIVHGDIKCPNILMGTHNCKLADFGSAKDVRTSFFRKVLFGTAGYKAPEVEDRTEQTYASDIFSVGCTVLAMVTGKHPDREEGRRADPAFANRVVPNRLSESCRHFLSKCFAADPRHRWTASRLLKHPFVAEPTDPRWRPYEYLPIPGSLNFVVEVGPHLLVPSVEYSSCLPAAPFSPIPVMPMKRRRLLGRSCRNVDDGEVVDGPVWSGGSSQLDEDSPQSNKGRPQSLGDRPRSQSSGDLKPSPVNSPRTGMAGIDKQSGTDLPGEVIRPPPYSPEFYPRDRDGNYVVPKRGELRNDDIRNNPRAMAAIASIQPELADQIEREQSEVGSEVGSISDFKISGGDSDSSGEESEFKAVAQLEGNDEGKSPLVVEICSEFGIPLPPGYGPPKESTSAIEKRKEFSSAVDRVKHNIRQYLGKNLNVLRNLKRPRNS